MVSYNIKINPKANKTYYSDIEFTVGDVRAHKLVFEFVNMDVSDCTLSVKAKRADGSIVIAGGNLCSEFLIPNNMYAIAGEVYFEIAVYNQVGGCVVTTVIAASVREGFGDEGIDADDRYQILTSLINAVDTSRLQVQETIGEFGDINAALDKIIEMQNVLTGGDDV